MKIVATRFGGPEVLQAVPDENQLPSPGEVVIRVRAVGVNHVDYNVYNDPRYRTSHGQKTPAFPLELGAEAAGVVTAVGANATGPTTKATSGA